jgi:hypothetical protein
MGVPLPEPTCIHHDPAHALSDLTGIMKHFCRKHGEKKWKCDKCSRRYAVQSHWKAHSKICGTREYRCRAATAAPSSHGPSHSIILMASIPKYSYLASTTIR